jgi:predicted phosphodiesterase
MPAGKQRLSEIMLYSVANGEATTKEHYGLTDETWNRYKREYRKISGKGIDTILRLVDQFSDEELKAIASSDAADKSMRNVTYSFECEEIKFLAISDTHFGSKFTNSERLYSAFAEAEKQGCSFMLHAGDVTEGMPNRPGSIYEMDCLGYKAQRDRAVEVLGRWKKKAYITGGNHDGFLNTKLGAGTDIVEDICSRLPDAMYVPDGKGVITLEPSGVTIGFWHGADSGAAYALSYRPQKIINSLKPHQKTNILCFGHDHKQFYIHYRNIHALGCGCIQAQTDWMASTGKDAMDGFHIVTVGLGNKEVKYFEPRFYPFYK